MEEDSSSLNTEPNPTTTREEDMGGNGGRGGGGDGGRGGVEPDFECNNTLNQPLLKRSPTLTSSHLAMVGAKVSHIESLDYEINENDLFKHDWRSRSKVQVLQYVFLKWTLAFLVGLLTGVIASLINLSRLKTLRGSR